MTKWLFGIAALFCLGAGAQTVQPIIQPEQHFVAGDGTPCAGCKLYSYVAGSTTPQPTYTDSTGTTPNTNPVVLDAGGAAQIWVGTSAYKFALLDTGGTTLWTVDNITAPLSGSISYLPLSGGTLTGGLTSPWYQFTFAANACGTSQFVAGWNTSGFICSVPRLAQSGHAAGCTTAASAFATCTTAVAFPIAYADTSYDASCTGQSPTDPSAAISGYVITDSQHVTVTTVTNNSVALHYVTISCVAVHN